MSPAPRTSPSDGDVVLSVIIPAFNEVDRIGGTVSRVLAFLDRQPYASELIVVLDGGRTGAAAAIAGVAAGRSNVQVLDNVDNRGKGYSVRRGMLASRGQYALFADADLSLPIEDSGRFLEELRAGADLAIGSRAVPGSQERGEQQRMRHGLSRLFNAIVRLVAVPGLRDTQCGFKAFNGERARALFAVQRIDGFGFDVEVLRIARSRGYRIVEVPVVCEYHPTSSVRKLQDGCSMLLDLVRVLWFSVTGAYRDAR